MKTVVELTDREVNVLRSALEDAIPKAYNKEHRQIIEALDFKLFRAAHAHYVNSETESKEKEGLI